eukprot:2007837-Pyramimonas_sp.AAC.1
MGIGFDATPRAFTHVCDSSTVGSDERGVVQGGSCSSCAGCATFGARARVCQVRLRTWQSTSGHVSAHTTLVENQRAIAAGCPS